LTLLFFIQAFGSVGANLLMLGIFFYMQQQFGWPARRNLLLASVEGMVYVAGALAANPISAKIGRRRLLRLVHAGMAVVTLVAWIYPHEYVVASLLLIYTLFSAAQWPLLESLISANAKDERLSRLLSIYNLTWSGTGAVTLAASGTLISHFPRGIFVVATTAHILAVAASFLSPLRRSLPAISAHGSSHAAAEPELLKVRTLAMNLSRVALPAAFAVLYALGAMMPSLPVILAFTPSMRTLVASVWMIARWFAFVIFGATVWWHTRPRLLFIATAAMLLAFWAITIRASTILPGMHLGQVTDGTVMICAQIVLGLAMGMIYSGSLYFGMVLSDGSTEHGGYHEALIGLGSVLGPGAGAIAQYAYTGNATAGIVAVSIVLFASVIASGWVSVRRMVSSPDNSAFGSEAQARREGG
jgi:hypothetical protein